MKNGVIISKLQALEGTLIELRSLGRVTTEVLRGDWRTRRAIERNLQVPPGGFRDLPRGCAAL
jgi:hypothetical protein